MKQQLPKHDEFTKEESKSMRKVYNKAITIINTLKYFLGAVVIGLAAIILNNIWGWIR